METKYANVFFVPHFNVIGGIETYIYELVKKYKDIEIVVAYSDSGSDKKQLRRIREYAKVIKVDSKSKIRCNKLFIMYRTNIDIFEADEVIQIIHADYKAQNLMVNKDKRIKEYYGVSKAVAKSYEELSNKEVGVCYNPLKIEKPKRVLKLISATRLTKEKGLDRMKKLVKELEKKDIPFLWLIFTNKEDTINSKNVIYMKPRLDIRDFISDADYLVQLSDTEAFSYSVLESLTLKTPVIVTRIPSFIEMGVKDGVNGYILDFDMNNLSVETIYSKIPKDFEFKPPKDKYDKLLYKKQSTYRAGKKVKVRCLISYYDNELEEHKTTKSDPWVITEDRAEELINNPRGKLIEIIE